MNSETNFEGYSMFISYAHHDEKFVIEFHKHLTSLKNEGVIKAWDDREITSGEDWDEVIHSSLEKADIILFFISSDFMASFAILAEFQVALSF